MTEIFQDPLKQPIDVHLGMRCYIRHIMSPLWQMGGFPDYANTIYSKLNLTDAK